MKRSSWRLLLALALLASSQQAWAQKAVWIEGEAPASANVKLNLAGWGHKDFLSGEKWLHLSVDADKLAATVPPEGALIRYTFELDQAGDYEVWNRVGFEWVRSPFRWRIDDADWADASPETPTTDLMEIDFFCEVAWLKLGRRPLKAGPHTLEIRLDRTKDKDGKPQRILYASDALVLHPGHFHPNGKFPPGTDGRDAQDRKAAETRFQVSSLPADGRQTALPLNGVWEICRDDEQEPTEVAAPIKALPSHPFWRAIKVPGDKNTLRPDLLLAHRLWYRTRVELPEGAKDRAWYLVFPQNSLNTTVFVNGTLCGFDKNPFAHVQIDITRAVKPGLNELWVGIRDAWYARTANPDDPMKLRRTFNLPTKFFHDGFQDLAYPVWASPQSGILTTPQLVSAGPVYAADVFVKPSVARHRLDAEVSLTNTTGAPAQGQVSWEAVDDATGRVEHTAPPKSFEVAAGTSHTVDVAADWKNPTLWWPNAPHLYRLRTTVTVGGRAVDVRETPFGFREWRVEGTKFTLNGIVWNLWGDLVGVGSNKEEWLKQYRSSGQRLMRLATAGQGGEASGWMGLSPDEALDFFDRNGVVVRRNSTLDGEAIGYAFSESDPKMKAKHGGTDLKVELMRNVRDQFVAQVKGERNHPSIQIWSMENEFAYINLINLLGNGPLMDAYEREEQALADAVTAADPTRTVMADGGGAFKQNTMPVHGDHYVFNQADVRYPDLAYEPYPEGGGRGRWTWDGKRPRYIGEEFFANGINPADYAMWGGEIAFQGKAQTREAITFLYRMLMEGYRWGGHYAGWHLWLGAEAPGQYGSSPWRAAFVRQYDSTFGSGQTVRRTFGLFNDTQYPDPLVFTRTLALGGKTVWTQTSTHKVAPGSSEKLEEEIRLPQVATRQEGELVLTLAAGGKDVFRDTKPVSVLPAPAPLNRSAKGAIALLDPGGKVAAYLKNRDVAFTPVNSLEALPESSKVLIVGPEAIAAKDSTSSRLAAFAAAGRTVLVLDQTHPLRYQSTPAGLEPAPLTVRDSTARDVPAAEGSTAFPEDAAHPAFRGLSPRDFLAWAPDHLVYHHAYLKPARNAKSLVQVGPRLQNSALLEVTAGKGLLLLCQLDVGKKLATNPVAQHLLTNLIDYGLSYKQEFRNAVAVTDDPLLVKTLDAVGLRYTRASEVTEALRSPDVKLAVVSATPANLKSLAADLDRLNSFTRSGGYLVLHGLTPQGLTDFNKVVGVEHLIRSFGRERVTFPAVRDPLTAGLTIGDIVLLSGQRMFPWTADEYVASDVFSHVVDYDDIAPFASSPFFAYANITNGFVGADGWPLIIDFPAPTDGKPYEIPIRFPRAETVTEYTHIASTNYMPTTRIELAFDGQNALAFSTKPTNEPQTFAIDPPRTCRTFNLRITGWEPGPGKSTNIGIDNIYIRVQRSDAFRKAVRPMVNVGGLMHYPRGEGGLVLCNLLLKDTEAVPQNATKKQTIVATILRNLRAPFSGNRSVIAGANLTYTPIDLSSKANQYRTDRGWFGDRTHTFAALPTGRQTFAGVTYNIYDFPTSPVPTAIMLGGPNVPNNLPTEVKGIPIGRKADALFFLQAARIDNRRNDQERLEKKPYELARYVVHYADGRTESIPLLSEIDVDDYRQTSPAPIPGAQIAWTRPYEGSDLSAVAYAKQWNNPRPDVAIDHIDLIAGPAHDRGIPALLALTAATANTE